MFQNNLVSQSAAVLGKIKTEKKAESSRKNGIDTRSHVLKVDFFEKIFPHPLRTNEYAIKFNLVIDGKCTTYNPDYFCDELGCFVECVTSSPNISQQQKKWAAAIKNKENLRVFWWDGTEITEHFSNMNVETIINGAAPIPIKKGGRPKKKVA